MTLFRSLGRHLDTGALDELTLTTNGSQLARYADELRDCGVRRVNVSVDTLDPGEVHRDHPPRPARPGARRARRRQARRARGQDQHRGAARRQRGRVRRPRRLVRRRRASISSFIEVMPMGDIGGENRLDQYLPLSMVRARLQRRWTLDETDYRTGGPARYATVRETGRRLGFITPLTHNFCESCNRVRLTCTGTLYMCLGPGGCRRSAHPAAPIRRRRGARGGDPRGDRPQAEGPRLHHRPPPQPARRRAPYERDRRVSRLGRRRACAARRVRRPEAEAAQQALQRAAPPLCRGRPGGCRNHRAARRRRLHARDPAPLLSAPACRSTACIAAASGS